MKRTALICLIIGLEVHGFSAECELFMKPSDFQLDKKLVAPSESKFFSNFGNKLQQAYISGVAKGFICENVNGAKKEACLNEYDQLSKEDTSKLDELSGTMAQTAIEAYGFQNTLYGFKTSANVPISEKHLCYLQNKYMSKVPSKEDISKKDTTMWLAQQKALNVYLEVARKVGISEDKNTIGYAFMNATLKNYH